MSQELVTRFNELAELKEIQNQWGKNIFQEISPDNMQTLISVLPDQQKELMSEIRNIKKNGPESIGYESAIKAYEALLILGDKNIGIIADQINKDLVQNAAPKTEDKATVQKVASSLNLKNMKKFIA